MRTAKKAKLNDIKIKMLIWGEPGAGKSRFALTAPKPLVIDLEHGTEFYGDEFDFLYAYIDQSNKTINNALNLTNTIISEIWAGEYKDDVDTLIIDPITDLLDNIESILCKTYEKIIGKNVLELNSIQKTKWYSYRRDGTRKILDSLINLPVNLIWIAREKNIWGRTKDGLAPIEKTYDGLEIIEHLADFVIHLNKKDESVVKKTRGIKVEDKIILNEWDDIANIVKDKFNKKGLKNGSKKN